MIEQLDLQTNKMAWAEVTPDFSFAYPGVQQVSILQYVAVGILALGSSAVFIIVRKKWELTKECGGPQKGI